MSTITAGTPDHLLAGAVEPHSRHTRGTAPSAEAVREELHKILGSAGFPATERTRKLLEYLVGETLGGRDTRIKAYCIGTTVFGRPESFDPQKDPIVRIEAARLRRELEHYYLTDGRGDPVIIDIPKGAYVPRFIMNDPGCLPEDDMEARRLALPAGGRPWAHPAPFVLLAGVLLMLIGTLALSFLNDKPQGQARAIQLPGLLVKPLSDLTQSHDSAILAQGLTERIIEKTSRFREIAVIPGDKEASLVPTSTARYEFGGTLRDDGTNVLVQTRLVDRTDGRVIWAESFNVGLRPKQLFDVETAIADQIATRVAEPSGIVFEAERRMSLDAPPENLNAYLCTLSAYAYRASFAASKFDGIRGCLAKAVADHPDYATAWALLSLAYVDEYRFSYPAPPNDATPPLERARRAALQATELDPSNVRGQQALMLALFFLKDYPTSIEVGERALTLNPNDVEMKGEFGHRLALYGEWDRGCRLVREALDSSARKIAYYKIILSMCSFFKNDMPLAASLMKQADAGDNPAYHVMAAAFLAQAGDIDAAREHRLWMEKNAPRQLTKLLVELPQRLVRPIDRQRFVDALNKAGFRPIK